MSNESGLHRIPTKARRVLEDILFPLRRIFADNLVGIYLYGSVVQECFNPEQSDIDFIVVVKNPLTDTQKDQLFELFNRFCNEHEYGDRLEAIFFTLEQIKRCGFPSPFLFCVEGGNCRLPQDKNDLDTDLPLTVRHIYDYGVALFGPEPDKLFSPPEWETLKSSILEEIRYSLEIATQKPLYAVLSLCRAFYSLETQDVSVTKLQGTEWGLQHFPQEFHPIIGTAMKAYQDGLTEQRKRFLLKYLEQFIAYCKKSLESTKLR